MPGRNVKSLPLVFPLFFEKTPLFILSAGDYNNIIDAAIIH